MNTNQNHTGYRLSSPPPVTRTMRFVLRLDYADTGELASLWRGETTDVQATVENRRGNMVGPVPYEALTLRQQTPDNLCKFIVSSINPTGIELTPEADPNHVEMELFRQLGMKEWELSRADSRRAHAEARAERAERQLAHLRRVLDGELLPDPDTDDDEDDD